MSDDKKTPSETSGQQWAQAPWDASGPVPRVETSGQIPAVETTGKNRPVETTGPVPPVETTGSVPAVETTGQQQALASGFASGALPAAIWEATGYMPPVQATGPIPPVQTTGPVPPVQTTGPIPSLHDTGPIPDVEITGKQPAIGSRFAAGAVPAAIWETSGFMPRVETTGSMEPVAPPPPVAANRAFEAPPSVPWDTTGQMPRVETTGPMQPVVPAGSASRSSDSPWDTTGRMHRIEAADPAEPAAPAPAAASRSSDVPWDTTGQIPRVETTGSLSGMETMVMRAYRGEGPSHGELEPDKAKSRTEHQSKRSPWPDGWFKRTCQSVLAAVIVVAAAFGVGFIPSSAPQPEPQEVSAHIDLACPGVGSLDGTLTGVSTSSATWQSSVAGPVTWPGPVFTQPVTGDSHLAGDGSLAGFVQYSQPGQSAATSCAQPLATGYLQVNDADATLVLTNPDSVDAVISVYLMGPSGDITADQLVDLTVPANGTTTEALADYASGIVPLGITWQSTIGRVVAWVIDNSKNALDIVAPTKDDVTVIVPAVSPDGSVSLLLTNPATVRATVSVQEITDQGTLPIVGGDQVVVEARSTISLDVSSAVQDQLVALKVTSDKPVAASAVAKVGTDMATVPGVAASQMGQSDMLGVVEGPSKLVVSSNAGNTVNVTVTMTAASGTVTTQPVTLAPATSQVVDVPAGSQAVRVHAAPGVVAALVVQPVDANATTDNATNGISIVRVPPDSAWHGVTPLWIEGQPRQNG